MPRKKIASLGTMIAPRLQTGEGERETLKVAGKGGVGMVEQGIRWAHWRKRGGERVDFSKLSKDFARGKDGDLLSEETRKGEIY